MAVASTAQMTRLQALEQALNRIGVTGAHRTILAIIVAGAVFDSFEQNTVGIIGPVLRESWGISATDIGLLNTITFASGAVGRLLSGYIGDRYGRRTMLVFDLLLFTLGAIICALAQNMGVLAAGRAVVGFGLGGEVSIAVTMLAEFCSARFRGTAVGLVNVGAGGIGNFLAPGFGLLIFAIFAGPDRWRYVFAALVLPAILVVFYRRFVPETPRFLLSRGDVAGANRALSRLASGRLTAPQVETETFIPESAQRDAVAPRASLTEIFRGPFARRTLPLSVAIWMTYGSQISVLTLMPTILVAQGYTITKSLLFTMVMQAGSLFGTSAASFFGYHLPRKPVLTYGAILACLAGLAFGFIHANVVLVLFLGMVFQFFVLMLNTTIFMYAPELFPTRIRAFGTAFIMAVGPASGSLMPLVAGRLFDAYGIGAIFVMIAAMYVIFALCIQLMPETFGRSLEDLNQPAGADDAVGELAVA
ncbi:MAG: MFS transporter [Stellaceae bacterium]